MEEGYAPPPPTAPPLSTEVTPFGTPRKTPLARGDEDATAPPPTPKRTGDPMDIYIVRYVRKYEIIIEVDSPEVAQIKEELVRKGYKELPPTEKEKEFEKELGKATQTVLDAYKHWIDRARYLLFLSEAPRLTDTEARLTRVSELVAPKGTSSLHHFVLKPKKLRSPDETPFYEDGGRFGAGLVDWNFREHDSCLFVSAPRGTSLYDELLNDPLAEKQIASQFHLLLSEGRSAAMIMDSAAGQFGPILFGVNNMVKTIQNPRHKELLQQENNLMRKFDKLSPESFITTAYDQESKINFLHLLHREYYLSLLNSQIRNWYYTVVLAVARVLDKQKWSSRDESETLRITRRNAPLVESSKQKSLLEDPYKAQYTSILERNNDSSTMAARDAIMRVVYEKILREVFEAVQSEYSRVLHVKEYTDIELRSLFVRWLQLKNSGNKYFVPEMRAIEDVLKSYRVDMDISEYPTLKHLQDEVTRLKLQQTKDLKFPQAESAVAYLVYDGLRQRTLNRMRSIRRDSEILQEFMYSQIVSMISVMIRESIDPLVQETFFKKDSKMKHTVSSFNTEYTKSGITVAKQMELLYDYVQTLVTMKTEGILGKRVQGNIEEYLGKQSPQESTILLLMCGFVKESDSIWDFVRPIVEERVIVASKWGTGDKKADGYNALVSMTSELFDLAKGAFSDMFDVTSASDLISESEFDLWASDKNVSRAPPTRSIGDRTATQIGLALSLLSKEIYYTRESIRVPLEMESSVGTMHVLAAPSFEMTNVYAGSALYAEVTWKCNTSIVERNVPDGSPPVAEYKDMVLYSESKNLLPNERVVAQLDWSRLTGDKSIVGGKIWAEILVYPIGEARTAFYETPSVHLELFDKCIRSQRKFSWTNVALGNTHCMNWRLDLQQFKNSCEGVSFERAIALVDRDQLQNYLKTSNLVPSLSNPAKLRENIPNIGFIDELVTKAFETQPATLGKILDSRSAYAIYYMDHLVHLAAERIRRLENEYKTDKELYENKKYTSSQIPLEYQSTTAHGSLCRELYYMKTLHSFLATAWKCFVDNAWNAPTSDGSAEEFLRILKIRQKALVVKRDRIVDLCDISSRQAKMRNGNKMECHASLFYDKRSGVQERGVGRMCEVEYCGSPNTATKVPDPHYVKFYDKNGNELSWSTYAAPWRIFYHRGSYVVDNVQQQEMVSNLEQIVDNYNNQSDAGKTKTHFRQTHTQIENHLNYISKTLYA